MVSAAVTGRDEGGQSTTEELFESYLRRRQAGGDAVSRAADTLLGDGIVGVTEEARQRIRQKLQQPQKGTREEEEEDSRGVGFLRLVQTEEEAAASAARREEEDATRAAARDPNTIYLERKKWRDARRSEGMLEYSALKRELMVLTSGVAAAGTVYCFFSFSLQAAVSYALGGGASYLYLVLLFNHADIISQDKVPAVFRKRIYDWRKKSTDPKEFFEKALAGSSAALASPRLAVPGALMGLWAVSLHAAGDPPEGFHLQLAPLLLGFLAYKAAVLIQTFRDNKDLLV